MIGRYADPTGFREVFRSGDFFRNKLLGQLKMLGIEPDPVSVVTKPVEGSLIMARDRLLARETR